MDIRKWELFADIAETHNFTLSGSRMGYTQSGVSHTIRKLENEIGFSLINRTNKGVTLTAYGKMLLPYVRSLIKHSMRLEEKIDSLNGLETGHITIGTYSSTAVHWLPKIIKAFLTDYPNIILDLREGGLEELKEWIETGYVDFAFISDIPSRSYQFIKIKEDPLLAILPPSYSLNAEASSFPITDFNTLPFIPSEAGIDYDISAALQAHNIKPPIRFSCKDELSIIAMVSQGLGVSILPGLILEENKSKVHTLPLEPSIYRTLGIGYISSDTLPIAAKTFIQYAQKLLT